MVRIGWSIVHREFTISDYYYFSILLEKIISNGWKVDEIDDIEDIEKYDVVVFNYPENRFMQNEVDVIKKYIKNGGKVIVLGYCNNEDCTTEAINTLTKEFGLELLEDVVIDNVNKIDDRGLIIATSKILRYNDNVEKIVLPCTASIKIYTADAYQIVLGEKTSKSTIGITQPVLFAGRKIGRGEIILGGTCVFWDNFSIMRSDNMTFALNLLKPIGSRTA